MVCRIEIVIKDGIFIKAQVQRRRDLGMALTRKAQSGELLRVHDTHEAGLGARGDAPKEPWGAADARIVSSLGAIRQIARGVWSKRSP